MWAHQYSGSETRDLALSQSAFRDNLPITDAEKELCRRSRLVYPEDLARKGAAENKNMAAQNIMGLITIRGPISEQSLLAVYRDDVLTIRQRLSVQQKPIALSTFPGERGPRTAWRSGRGLVGTPVEAKQYFYGWVNESNRRHKRNADEIALACVVAVAVAGSRFRLSYFAPNNA